MAEAWQERDRGAPPSQADLKPGGYGQVALEIVDAMFQNRPRIMVCGLEAVSGGEIRIAGELVNQLPPRQRDIAMVFQDRKSVV